MDVKWNTFPNQNQTKTNPNLIHFYSPDVRKARSGDLPGEPILRNENLLKTRLRLLLKTPKADALYPGHNVMDDCKFSAPHPHP